MLMFWTPFLFHQLRRCLEMMIIFFRIVHLAVEQKLRTFFDNQEHPPSSFLNQVKTSKTHANRKQNQVNSGFM